jgi:hypothetical protein
VDGLEDRVCLSTSVGWDGPGRGSATLSYYVGSVPGSLGQAAVETAIRTALNAWSAVAQVTFVRTTTPGLARSLDFTFAAIDGAGGTLAQAYFPADVNPARIAGDVQFDEAESWEVGNARGTAAFDLVLAAAHEIGHALGLDHATGGSTIMGTTISPSQAFAGLGASDRTAILSLYAPAGTTTTTPTTPTIPATPTVPTVPSGPGFGNFGRPPRWRGR